MLQQFIEQLSKDLGFEQPLEPNEDGSYALRFEPDIVVIARTRQDVVFLHAELADVPSHHTDDFLLLAMSANLFGQETGNHVLGLNLDGKKVVLTTFLQEGKGYKAFHEWLEDFVNYADAWRQEVIHFGD